MIEPTVLGVIAVLVLIAVIKGVLSWQKRRPDPMSTEKVPTDSASVVSFKTKTHVLPRPSMPSSPQDIEALATMNMDEILNGGDIYSFICGACAKSPDRAALIMLEDPANAAQARIVTYSNLVAGITQAANLFRALGADKQSSVTLLASTTPETHFAYFGAMTASVVNPVNPFLEVDYIAGIMNAAKSRILVVTGPSEDPDIAKKALALKDKVTTLEHILFFGDSPAPEYPVFESAIGDYSAAALQFDRNVSPEQLAAFFHTGGTTGIPKLAKHTHRGQLLNAYFSGLINGNEANGVVGHGMPMFHVGGAILLSLRTLINAQTCLLLTRSGFRTPSVVQNFWSIIELYQVSSTMAVPAVCAALLNATDAPSSTPLRFFSTGASTVPEQLANGFYEKFGIHLRELWGMTELQGLATSNFATGSPRIGSAGVCMPYNKMMVIEESDGSFLRECATCEAGLIVFRGPTVIDGYVDKAHTESSFLKNMPDGHNWLNTGDLGKIDEDGFVWIIGRAKDIIIRGGHNIDPVIIEDALLKHPSVSMVAAIGRPDQAKGEMPVAYVQLTPDANVSLEELEQCAVSNIPERAAIPEQIIISDALPLTAVGKIFKPELRTDITEKTVFAHVSSLGLAVNLEDIRAEFDKQVGLVVSIDTAKYLDKAPNIKQELESALSGYPFTLRLT